MWCRGRLEREKSGRWGRGYQLVTGEMYEGVPGIVQAATRVQPTVERAKVTVYIIQIEALADVWTFIKGF